MKDHGGGGCCYNSYNISRVTQQEGKHLKERREGMVPLWPSDLTVHGSVSMGSSRGDRLRLTWRWSRMSLLWSRKNCVPRGRSQLSLLQKEQCKAIGFSAKIIYGGTIGSPEYVFIRPLCRYVPPSTGVSLYSEIQGVGHQRKQQDWRLRSPSSLISSLSIFICEIKT